MADEVPSLAKTNNEERWLSRNRPAKQGTFSSSMTTTCSGKSLIENLSDAGFATIAFTEGPSALRHLTEVGAPDIILLDWKMPEMTGTIELLSELRRRSIATPVVFLRVLGDQIYEEAGLHGGAVDFIEKSRGFSIILRRIDLILGELHGGQAAHLSQRAPLFAHGKPRGS